MQLGRCPVIIADDWVPPLGPDWGKCAVRIPERHIRDIPTILRGERERWAERGAAARRVWEQYYDERPRFLGYFQSICDLSQQRSSQPPLTVERLQQRMHSWAFSWNAGWLSFKNIIRRLMKR
jgi:hypothetical protein